jgi:ribonuclease HI
MLLAYSDAGLYRERGRPVCAAVSVILSESRFIKLLVSKHRGVTSPDSGELIGVCQSLEYLARNYGSHDCYAVYTDSCMTIGRFNEYRISGVLDVPKCDEKRWQRLLELCAGKNVLFRHVQAHLNEHNPNKICDMIATKALNRVR